MNSISEVTPSAPTTKQKPKQAQASAQTGARGAMQETTLLMQVVHPAALNPGLWATLALQGTAMPAPAVYVGCAGEADAHARVTNQLYLAPCRGCYESEQPHTLETVTRCCGPLDLSAKAQVLHHSCAGPAHKQGHMPNVK